MCTGVNEQKKEWLLRYLRAKASEKVVLDEMEELRASYVLPSPTIDDMPHGDGNGSDLSDYAVRYDQLYHKLIRAYTSRMEIYDEIVRAVNAMQASEAEKCILRYRYILGYSWEKIAVTMNYTYRHVTRLHGQALGNLNV